MLVYGLAIPYEDIAHEHCSSSIRMTVFIVVIYLPEFWWGWAQRRRWLCGRRRQCWWGEGRRHWWRNINDADEHGVGAHMMAGRSICHTMATCLKICTCVSIQPLTGWRRQEELTGQWQRRTGICFISCRWTGLLGGILKIVANEKGCYLFLNLGVSHNECDVVTNYFYRQVESSDMESLKVDRVHVSIQIILRTQKSDCELTIVL